MKWWSDVEGEEGGEGKGSRGSKSRPMRAGAPPAREVPVVESWDESDFESGFSWL